MADDLVQWHFFDARMARRLSFLSHPSRPTAASTSCRLPECDAVVERSGAPGRTGWFHDHRCADEYRTRVRALDAAIDALARKYQSDGIPKREQARLKADLEWLLEAKATYPQIGAWRRPDRTGDDGSPVDQFIRGVHGDEAASPAVDPCPTCRGTGDLAEHREQDVADPVRKKRMLADTLAEIAPLVRRLVDLKPSLGRVKALDTLAQEAERAEQALQQSMSARQTGPQDKPD